VFAAMDLLADFEGLGVTICFHLIILAGHGSG